MNPQQQPTTPPRVPGYPPYQYQPAQPAQPAAPAAVVQVADVNNAPTTARNVVGLIKDVVVIVTCLVILYTLVKGYLALHEFEDRLSQLSTVFGN